MGKKYKESYILNLLLSLDQLGNAIINGDCDETISSVLGKMVIENKLEGRPLMTALVYVLDTLDENHCLDAIEWDRGRTFEDMFGKYVPHRRDGKH
jgi:hypothetical protein